MGTAAAAKSAGRAANDAQIESRNQRGAEGRLILAVRTRSTEQADQVTELMRKAGATSISPVMRVDEVRTAGVTAASWTGG
ncbi:MAG: hypothetical protein H7Z10_01325 [Gemmatimonadaceae bacterium]|nr:hypothetical protein [Acetobacteraceae bacterium]